MKWPVRNHRAGGKDRGRARHTRLGRLWKTTVTAADARPDRGTGRSVGARGVLLGARSVPAASCWAHSAPATSPLQRTVAVPTAGSSPVTPPFCSDGQRDSTFPLSRCRRGSSDKLRSRWEPGGGAGPGLHTSPPKARLCGRLLLRLLLQDTLWAAGLQCCHPPCHSGHNWGH